jgi:hypothetical protein
LVGALDGARDGLLGEIIGFRAVSGHAVTERPKALPHAFDGGEHANDGLSVGYGWLHGGS